MQPGDRLPTLSSKDFTLAKTEKSSSFVITSRVVSNTAPEPTAIAIALKDPAFVTITISMAGPSTDGSAYANDAQQNKIALIIIPHLADISLGPFSCSHHLGCQNLAWSLSSKMFSLVSSISGDVMLCAE